MTNKQAREVAKQVLDHAWRDSSTHSQKSNIEAIILAYRAEVRREVLMEARKQYVPVPDCDNYESRAAAIDAAYEQRRLFRAMLDEMIAETAPAETTAPINTGGRSVVVGCDPEDAADLDTVLRTLAQAYVGNDYTIEGRKFQDAVGRLWPR